MPFGVGGIGHAMKLPALLPQTLAGLIIIRTRLLPWSSMRFSQHALIPQYLPKNIPAL